MQENVCLSQLERREKLDIFCGLRLPEGIKLIYLSDRTTISFTSTPPYVKKYTSSEVGRSRLKCLVRLDKSLVEKKENCALLKTKTEDKYICIIFAINKTGVVRSGPYSAQMQFGQKKQILSLTENKECQWTCTLMNKHAELQIMFESTTVLIPL